jgi:hypothetical protein
MNTPGFPDRRGTGAKPPVWCGGIILWIGVGILMVGGAAGAITGYCAQAAWASGNPGDNADDSPARRLKKVILAIGSAC